jgi:hypothetical protein
MINLILYFFEKMINLILKNLKEHFFTKLNLKTQNTFDILFINIIIIISLL